MKETTDKGKTNGKSSPDINNEEEKSVGSNETIKMKGDYLYNNSYGEKSWKGNKIDNKSDKSQEFFNGRRGQ